MMKYEKLYNNFIPKEERKTNVLDIKSLEEKNHLLTEENHRLQTTLESYKQQFNNLELDIKDKEKEIMNAKNSISFLENDIEKFQLLKDDLHKVDTLKSELNSLNSHVTRLNQENATLAEEVESYRQQVQMLYLIILVLAVL